VPPLPFSPGGEVAGVVRAVGEKVEGITPGERVAAVVPWGGFADTLITESGNVAPIPDGMDFETAASLTLTYGTAMHALVDRAAVQPGESVLILGAAGGVGTASIQVAKALGARVIAAASTESKLELCRTLGADETINYVDEDLKKRAKALIGGQGADVVVDSVGADFAEPALRATAWNGRYLVIGFAAGDIPKLPLNLVLLKGCAVVGVFWGAFVAREPARHRAHMEQLASWSAEGRIAPAITARYPLSEATQALVDMADRKVRGKVVLLP
jgi:NADPH2:quinone reductase